MVTTICSCTGTILLEIPVELWRLWVEVTFSFLGSFNFRSTHLCAESRVGSFVGCAEGLFWMWVITMTVCVCVCQCWTVRNDVKLHFEKQAAPDRNMRYCAFWELGEMQCNEKLLKCVPRLCLSPSVCLLVCLSCFFHIRQTCVSVFRDEAVVRSRYVAMATREVQTIAFLLTVASGSFSVRALHSSASNRSPWTSETFISHLWGWWLMHGLCTITVRQVGNSTDLQLGSHTVSIRQIQT